MLQDNVPIQAVHANNQYCLGTELESAANRHRLPLNRPSVLVFDLDQTLIGLDGKRNEHWVCFGFFLVCVLIHFTVRSRFNF